MQRDPQTRALEVCIQRLQAGELPEKILELYPQFSEFIEPRLEAAQALQLFSTRLQAPESAQAYSRSRMIQEINRLASPPRHRSCSGWLGLAILVTSLVSVFLIFLAASKSLPGDFIYPLKHAIRQVQYNITPTSARRLALERSFDQQRLDEVNLLIQKGREQTVNFAAGLRDMPPGTWKIDDLEITVSSNTQLIGQINPGIFVDVTGTTSQDGTIQVKQLRPRQFIITGIIEQIDDESWTVDGIPFLVNEETLQLGRFLPGAHVTVTAMMRLNGELQARVIEAATP